MSEETENVLQPTKGKDAVGQLEEESKKRKERLKAMRQKLSGMEDGEDASAIRKIDLPLPKPAFRSYKPQDEALKESSKPIVKPIEIESEVIDTIEQGNVKTLIDEVELTNLAPRKPDWDLKRDVANKLAKLERRTQKAITELILDRLKDSKDLESLVEVSTSNSKLVK